MEDNACSPLPCLVMEDRCDIAIVGAGAAGLTTAIFAAEGARERKIPIRIVLLDGAKAVGAKILVSGGGRCNVTHEVVRVGDYNGNPNIIRNVLAAFDEQATVRWLQSLGVNLKREETGKLFPVTDKARTVLEALVRRCEELGVELRAGHRVKSIARMDGNAFRVGYERGELMARRVVLATGGRSLPRTGSDGFGYELAKSLGHTVTATHPALVPLVLEDSFFQKDVQGLAHEAELVTVVDNRPVDRRTGSLLWTHFGLSGPLAMDASRHWLVARATAGANVELRLSVLPGMQFEQVEQSLIPKDAAAARRSVRTLVAERLAERLAEALLRHVGIDPTTPGGAVPRERRRGLAHALTGLVLPVVRDRGWNYAEVTAGGVPLAEINFRRMESRKTEHLYLVGEILDCDGRIGGFNFQWAWATGYVAGRAVAVSLEGGARG